MLAQAGPDLSVVIIVLITFIAPAIPILIIGMVYYYKKKLEQKQILAAIEKGVPVAELNIGRKKQNKTEGPGWIQDQSKGITLTLIGIGIAVAFWFLVNSLDGGVFHVMWIVPIVFLGNGIGLLIRSNMRRKYEKTELQEQPPSQI
ncbi:MAG: DUF6249 domain-containing protein [Planctomycetota bacterium]|jgi:hypothetical protein